MCADGSTYIDQVLQTLADGVPVAVNGSLSVNAPATVFLRCAD
jgi:hypothetical protein